MPRHHTNDGEWIFSGRDRQANTYYEELLSEGKNIPDAYDLAVKAFPDCRPYLKWLAR